MIEKQEAFERYVRDLWWFKAAGLNLKRWFGKGGYTNKEVQRLAWAFQAGADLQKDLNRLEVKKLREALSWLYMRARKGGSDDGDYERFLLVEEALSE